MQKQIKRTAENRGPFLTDNEKILIGYLYENNFSCAQIADYFGRHASCIWRLAIDLKLERKDIKDALKDFEFRKIQM